MMISLRTAAQRRYAEAMTALLTCGHTRAGLAAVRSLGRAGHAVVAGAPVTPALAHWSRFASSTLLLPDPQQQPSDFAAAVAEQAHARAARTLLVATDAGVWGLSRFRAALPSTMQAAMPPHHSVVLTLDRVSLRERLQRAHLPTVDAFTIDGVDDVEPVLRRLQRDGGLPALVRPRPSLWTGDDRPVSTDDAAVAVDDIATLRQLLYRREDLVAGGCTIEPRPRGVWLAYGTVCSDDGVWGEVFQQRVHELDDLSGVSTLARTLPVDEDLRRVGRVIIDELSLRGPVLIECFRGVDQVTRVVNVIPRLWGSVQLAIAAGFDVPRLMHEGGNHRAPAVARSNMWWRWPVGDARLQLSRVQGRRRPVVEVARTLAKRMSTGAENLDVWAADDPAPALLELRQWFNRPRPHVDEAWWHQALGRNQ
jgi:predicted ATP-grasp superfamily ATP-dependent carboligase